MICVGYHKFVLGGISWFAWEDIISALAAHVIQGA